MKIAITTVQVPFITGGAEMHTNNLKRALQDAGHQVEIVTMPFWFNPPSLVRDRMDSWEKEDLTAYLSGSIDRVIALKFPTYYLKHPNKVVWLLHPHSSLYDFYDTPYGAPANDAASVALRNDVLKRDANYLSGAKNVFTVSKYLSNVMDQTIGVRGQALYHPPPVVDAFHCEDAFPYIFFPSRLESQKRQQLLIQAMQYVSAPITAVIAGNGGQYEPCRDLVRQLHLTDRVKFVGNLEGPSLWTYYSRAFAVYFGPFHEPYGYITFEAMLSSKPVITCRDSGGPTEFVLDGETGVVTDPNPVSIANSIDTLWGNKKRASEMGRAGRKRYESLGLSWDNVVSQLTR
ncbi:glycosyltransferase family 4 protein [Paraburkholderia sp. HD33-4]|uniref:glycosyltransferase family 4 protein n=1 Tax=Paraburkholderia sp. HD33-4 TaxID=2883242 RepID=UPI001F484E48|nr:glycosyltransferase family 4 protein [Paraburkholderia sp. HD33-4]